MIEFTNRVPTCFYCERMVTGPLQRCGKCKKRAYCCRDCQKEDWKIHRNNCDLYSTLPPRSELVTKNLLLEVQNPFHKILAGTWIHDRPEQDVYKLLIDSYRLRMNDHYNVNVDIERDSIYGKKPNPQEGFRRYLRLAETRNGLLPSWWSQEKAVECVDFSTKNQWSSLENPIGKDDVREHYEHPFMTLQLRLFGQQVYGRGPGGNDGYKVLQIQLIAEEEGVYILPKDESHRIPRK